MKILTYILIGMICSNCFASSAMYMSKLTRRHFKALDFANKIEAEDIAKNKCIKYVGEDKANKCELIGSTNYGGYASYVASDKAQGYALGKSTQAKADKIALQACTRISEQYKCEIVHQWQDKVGESSDGTAEENKFFVQINPLFILKDDYSIRSIKPEEYTE
jgi:Domain of unknown function (DUF4189)